MHEVSADVRALPQYDDIFAAVKRNLTRNDLPIYRQAFVRAEKALAGTQAQDDCEIRKRNVQAQYDCAGCKRNRQALSASAIGKRKLQANAASAIGKRKLQANAASAIGKRNPIAC